MHLYHVPPISKRSGLRFVKLRTSKRNRAHAKADARFRRLAALRRIPWRVDRLDCRLYCVCQRDLLLLKETHESVNPGRAGHRKRNCFHCQERRS